MTDRDVHPTPEEAWDLIQAQLKDGTGTMIWTREMRLAWEYACKMHPLKPGDPGYGIEFIPKR